MISCNSQQIQQVLMNLITNARDALNSKYPSHDTNKYVAVSARSYQHDNMIGVRISVEDSGTGIADHVLERMFDPFFTTKPREKGTGLGLAISHSIVKDHHGELSVETEPGSFTRFHVDLPTADSEGDGTCVTSS